MKTRFLTLLGVPMLALVLTALPFAAETRAETGKPIPFIFDTDMGNDVDDALALAMLHSFMNRAECDLLAVTLTKSSPKAVDYVQFINGFYGRPDIPIGLASKEVTPDEGKYIGKVFELKDADGKPLFPLPERKEALPSVTLLRKTLAAADDDSVVIAQVGFSSNLAALLDSPADDISPLTGKELAAKKVKFVAAMFGNYKNAKHPEYNVVTDIPSAQKFVAEWPTEIHFSGYEIGESVIMTSSRVRSDFGYIPAHPIKESFLLYRDGVDENQATFDLTCVLEPIRLHGGYFGLSELGRVTVHDDGTVAFVPDENGRHLIFRELTPEQIARVQEAFYYLSSEPPRKNLAK